MPCRSSERRRLAVVRISVLAGRRQKKGFHRRRGYGGQGILNSKAPIAEILFMEQLGEIGQRVHMMVES